ncbi:MAG: NAD+ synthase [bacterium]|nr:NAD+ synthase [bacterium]
MSRGTSHNYSRENKMKLVDDIANWIRIQVEQSGAEGVVLGLSGGVDSSVVAALSKKAVGERVLGLIMPCGSSPIDEENALLVASQLGIKTQRINLEAVCRGLLEVLPPGTGVPPGNKLALANLKPRLRMITLYYYANNLNYLVSGTGNKSEIMVGYFTKYGDGGVDILPVGGIVKSQVRDLAKELGIPKEIIDKPPSAGLWQGQTDEEELCITYAELDKTILALESKMTEDIDAHILSKVENLIKVSAHKRALPKIFEEKK